MITPLPPLVGRSLDDASTCLHILTHDKHQIAEGMVVESLFDQIIEFIPENLPGEVTHVLDIETFITRSATDFNKAYAFILTRRGSYPTGLGRFVSALQRGFTVYQVEYVDDAGFKARHVGDFKKPGAWQPLERLMEAIGRPSGEYVVAREVRNEDRQLASFWGYLRDTHGDRLRDKVAIPRLLVNWGIQPWFRSVWNIDRVILVGDRLWALEAKHKFPYETAGGLRFGLNNGEAFLIRDLAACGINALHTIIVKPYWDMNVGSSYLLNGFEARKNALVIGRIYDKPEINKLLQVGSSSSPAHTSITGVGRLKFKAIPAAEFHHLGRLSDPDDAAQRIGQLLRGGSGVLCQESDLRNARLESPA